MRLLILTPILLALVAAGCGGQDAAKTVPARAGAPADRGTVVDIRTFNFQPDPLTIRAGTEVTFVNHDAIDHTVTSGTRAHPDGRFDDKLAPARAGRSTSATVTFSKPGRYRYFCAIHPGAGMTAEVVVR
jgi:plastocyanin